MRNLFFKLFFEATLILKLNFEIDYEKNNSKLKLFYLNLLRK